VEQAGHPGRVAQQGQAAQRVQARRQQRGGVPLRERAQLQVQPRPSGPGGARPQRGEPPLGGVPAVGQRGDEGRARRVPGEVVEEFQGERVGAVRVVQHQQQPLRTRGHLEHRPDGPDQPVRLG
jgi:hypothetical protein